MFASAEGASRENSVHILPELYAEAPFYASRVSNKCTKQAVFLERSESRARELVVLRRLQNKEERCSRAPKARAEKLSVIICEVYAKCSFAPPALVKRAQNKQDVHNAPESNNHELVVFARGSKTKRKRCSRAPKARAEKIWVILCEVYEKVLFRATGSGKTCTKQAVCSECSKVKQSRTRAPPKQRGKDARERRRRERRKFGAFFDYASFTQKYLLGHCAWQKVHKTRSILKMLQSYSHTNTWVLRAHLEQRETCSRALKARAEKIWSILCKVYAKTPFAPLSRCALHKEHKTRSILRVLQSHSFTNTWVLRAPPRQTENDARERRRHERRKFGASHARFKSAFCTTVPCTKSTKHAVF